MNQILVMLRAMAVLWYVMLFQWKYYRCSECSIVIRKRDTKCFRCNCIFEDGKNEKH